jgi:lipopolysaccharide export system protein LptA
VASVGSLSSSIFRRRPATAKKTPIKPAVAKARAWRYLENDIQEQADKLVYSLANDISVMAGEIGLGESDQKPSK